MKTIDVTTHQSLTRRTAVRNLLAIGAMSVAALAGNDSAFAAATRRSDRDSDHRDRHTESREHGPRRPRISAGLDHASSAVIVIGDGFSRNARVNITVNTVDYSIPPISSSLTVGGFASYRGRLNQSVPISPVGCTFTGRVEAVDPLTGRTATRNFSAIVC